MPKSRSLLAIVLLSGAVACARSVSDPIDPLVTSFATEIPPVQTACVETSCPAPYASCTGELLCATDLTSDVDHCGACDTPCPKSTKASHGTYLCSDSQCKIACQAYYADCNHDASDGCEQSTWQDPANCGGCGVACKDGDLCWKGACGCPNGFTRCGDDCVQTDSDNENCGACGVACKEPKLPDDPRWICGPNVNPDNTEWTCGNAACTMQCKGGFGDCNASFCGDGCETDFLHDENNCGACGNACASGQWCNDGTCSCPAGTTRCHDECVDTMNDAANCGACGSRCDGPSVTRPGHAVSGGPLCVAGQCSYVCKPGFANCNGKIEDGCEADLNSDQKNCGACGNACNVALGQPCFQGKCLSKECKLGPGPN